MNIELNYYGDGKCNCCQQEGKEGVELEIDIEQVEIDIYLHVNLCESCLSEAFKMLHKDK